MANYSIEYDEKDIKRLIRNDLYIKYGFFLQENDLLIKVMSKRVQEWESGKIQCAIDFEK